MTAPLLSPCRYDSYEEYQHERLKREEYRRDYEKRESERAEQREKQRQKAIVSVIVIYESHVVGHVTLIIISFGISDNRAFDLYPAHFNICYKCYRGCATQRNLSRSTSINCPIILEN